LDSVDFAESMKVIKYRIRKFGQENEMRKFLNYESCCKPDSTGKIACRMCGCMLKYGQGINKHATVCKKKFNEKNSQTFQ